MMSSRANPGFTRLEPYEDRIHAQAYEQEWRSPSPADSAGASASRVGKYVIAFLALVGAAAVLAFGVTLFFSPASSAPARAASVIETLHDKTLELVAPILDDGKANSSEPEPLPAPLPSGWVKQTNEAGKVYYYQESTQKTQWTRPAADKADNASAADVHSIPEEAEESGKHRRGGPDAPLLDGWAKYKDHAGKVYYYNAGTKETRWKRPAQKPADAPGPDAKPAHPAAKNEPAAPDARKTPAAPGTKPAEPPKEEHDAAASPALRSGGAPSPGPGHPRQHEQPATAAARGKEHHAATKSLLPPGWVRHRSADGKVYYFEVSTNLTQWDPPAAHSADKPREPKGDAPTTGSTTTAPKETTSTVQDIKTTQPSQEEKSTSQHIKKTQPSQDKAEAKHGSEHEEQDEAEEGELPEGWVAHKSQDGVTFYYQVGTHKTQWTRPTAEGAAPSGPDAKPEDDSEHAPAAKKQVAAAAGPVSGAVKDKKVPAVAAGPNKSAAGTPASPAHAAAKASASNATRHAVDLPEGWTVHEADGGKTFYHHANMGKSQWIHPGMATTLVAETPAMGAQTSEAPATPAAPQGATLHLCTKEECLRIVDNYLDTCPRSRSGLLQGRGDGTAQRLGRFVSLGGGACGQNCALPGTCPEGPAKCRHDTYDNAVAAIYYIKRGKLDSAKAILDAFLKALYPKTAAGFEPLGKKTLYTGIASGHPLTLLASSYNSAHFPVAGNYQDPFVTDGGVDTGNNAWAALAFAHYGAAARAPCYATVARDILGAIVEAGTCGDMYRGFLGHLPPYPGNYRATEHNVDIFALAKVLNNITVQKAAHQFIHSMRGANDKYPDAYAMGTGAEEPCDTAVNQGAAPADAIFWNLLADADDEKERMTSALRWAFQVPERNGAGRLSTRGLWVTDSDIIRPEGGIRNPPVNVTGTRFSSFGNGVQWEVTASAVMALAHYQRRYDSGKDIGLPERLAEARDSLRALLGMYNGVPQSVLGGNYGAWQSGKKIGTAYPGGTDTGLGWPYLRYLGTVSTAWTGLALMFQTEPSDRVNEDANPYAPPSVLMPIGAEESCLPPSELIK